MDSGHAARLVQIRHAETTYDTQAHAQITAGHVLVGVGEEGLEGGVQEVEERIVLLRSQQEDIPHCSDNVSQKFHSPLGQTDMRTGARDFAHEGGFWEALPHYLMPCYWLSCLLYPFHYHYCWSPINCRYLRKS